MRRQSVRFYAKHVDIFEVRLAFTHLAGFFGLGAWFVALVVFAMAAST